MKKGNVIITIPIYTTHLSEQDWASIKQCFKILQDYTICYVVQVLEGPLVEQVVHLLQGHLVIAQGEAFQQRNRFGKRIIAVPVFRGLRVKQAHFFIVLEQVGGYTHVLGVGPDAVVFGFLIVRHGLNCFPRPAAV